MNLLDRVHSSRLPAKQFKVIEAILDDLESNSFLSGGEICEKFQVSFSSLTRLAKSLGYSGFPALKKDIEKLYKTEFSPTRQAEGFLNESKDQSVLNFVYESELNGLRRLKEGLNEEELLLLARHVNKSKRVFIIGVGYLLPIVQKLASGLKILGKEVIPFTDVGFSKKVELYSVGETDVFIIFSMNKELTEIGILADDLKRNNIFSALFTDKKSGHLRKRVGVSFYTPSSGNGMINCMTPFVVVTNILESYLFSLDKHVHLTKVKNIEESWNSLPIFLG